MKEEVFYFWGTGRRKTSVARVRLKPGSGLFFVNRHEFEEYFPREHDRVIALSPLVATKKQKKYDVFVNVRGGGISGQAGAIRLGIARALKRADPSLEHLLKTAGHLTRDGRMKERKKYGRRGARRGFQFSKR